MKDNERALMCAVVVSDNMVDHVVHEMQSDFELSMVDDVTLLKKGFDLRCERDLTLVLEVR